jgi:hypothetical protein
MQLTKSEWEKTYKIEDNLKVKPNKNIEFLLELIHKENAQVIDPKTNKMMHDIIDNIQIVEPPKGNITKEEFIESLGRFYKLPT